MLYVSFFISPCISSNQFVFRAFCCWCACLLCSSICLYFITWKFVRREHKNIGKLFLNRRKWKTYKIICVYIFQHEEEKTHKKQYKKGQNEESNSEKIHKKCGAEFMVRFLWSRVDKGKTGNRKHRKSIKC